MASSPGKLAPSPIEGEPSPDAATAARADETSASRSKGLFPPPRKLTDEQEREVARLYAETDTPLGEIARRFSIGQSSVQRIAQRQGAPLRSGRGTPPGPGQAAEDTSRRSPRAAASAAEPQPAPVAARGQRGRSRQGGQAAAPRGASASAPTAASQASAGGLQRRFRVRFVAERVVEAEHMREVIAQVEALGATEITSIARED
jgi:transposase-like protein